MELFWMEKSFRRLMASRCPSRFCKPESEEKTFLRNNCRKHQSVFLLTMFWNIIMKTGVKSLWLKEEINWKKFFHLFKIGQYKFLKSLILIHGMSLQKSGKNHEAETAKALC